MNLFREQPRAFHMIFMMELWERLGYYTTQGLLTLYFIRFLGFSELESYYTFGAFSALVYALVVIGGYLGDKVLGTKRTILLGLIVLICGYSALSLTDKEHVFLALGLICIGNGLFKANPGNLLAKCYAPNDPRLHGGFTLYYMSINLGSVIALTAGPSIASRYGYSPAYLLSTIGLVLGLVNYCMRRHHVAEIYTPADEHRISWWQWLLFWAGIGLATYAVAYLLQHLSLAKNLLWVITLTATFSYFYLMKNESRVSRLKMLVAFILMIEAIIFFVLYQQMPTSLNLFAVNNVTPNIFGLSFDPQSFQALNPFWIIVMSPVLAHFYRGLNKKKIVFTTPYKFALGMTMCALSFLSLYFARYFYGVDGMVSSWWLTGSYLLQSIGELLVSALGVAMVAELVPAAIAGYVMGIWFLTTAIAGFLGATVASYTALPTDIKPGVDSLMIYTKVFACIGGVTLLIAVAMWLFAPLLNRLMTMNKEATEEEKNLRFSTALSSS